MTLLKKFILFLLLFCINSSFASEEIFLDINPTEIHQYNTGELQYENKKVNEEDDENYLKPSFKTIKDLFNEDFCNKESSTNKKK